MSLNTILATTPLTSTGYHLKATGTTIGNSLIWDNGTNVGIGNTNTSYTLDVSGTFRTTNAISIQNNQNATSTSTFSNNDTTNASSRQYVDIIAGNRTLSLRSINGDNTFIASNGGNILLQPNNATAMTLTSAGNVGIGTSSPNVSGQGTDQRVLTIQGVGGVWGGVEVSVTGNTSAGALNGFYGFTNASLSAGYKLVSYIGSWLDGGGVTSGADMRFHTQANGAANAIERMRILSGGNVGIGTINPSKLFTVVASANGQTAGISGASYGIRFDNGGTYGFGGSTIHGVDNTLTASYQILALSGSQLLFATGGTERMRITTGGQLLVGKTSNSARLAGPTIEAESSFYSGGSQAGYFWEDRSTSANWYGWYATSNVIYLYNGSANAAQIIPSTGVYTPLSDINKKKDFEVSTIGLNAVLGLKPTLYRMKTDDESASKELGFIAQEVKEYIPQAYVESGEGKDIFIGLNYNAIVAALVKSVQELKSEIDELKNK